MRLRKEQIDNINRLTDDPVAELSDMYLKYF